MIDRAITVLLIILIFTASAAGQDAAARRRAALYEPLISQAGERYGVDPRVLWTVAFLETKFQPRLVSQAGARGMMQFMPMTARRYGLHDPFDPAAAIDAAARYLRDLQERFDHRLDLMLAAYNAGEHAVLAFRDGRQLRLSDGRIINPKGIRTGGVPPYRETRSYVRNGLALYLRLAAAEDNAMLKAVKNSLQIIEVELEEGGEDMPPEILELKRGSIYLTDGSPQPDRPAQSSRSIYPR
jgi:soluble lytic murein transglycosylase-like protein